MAKQDNPKRQPLKNTSAVVCGGSKGIGKERAREIVLLGGSVCIIARHMESLVDAAREIRDLTRDSSQSAIVGFTEVLRNELKPYNIHFSVLYPPDTDTPGFEMENRTKPGECALMSEKIKLLSARKVAQIFVEGIIKGKYAIFPGDAGFVWRINRHLPWLVRWIIDAQYRRARRKLGKEH